MEDNQARELYELVKSEMKKSDLEDLHEIAYNYASIETSRTTETFLDIYITGLIRLFRMYQKENIQNINNRINKYVFIENGRSFQGFEIELSEQETILRETRTINLNNIPDLKILEQQIMKLQQVFRNDRGKGRNNGRKF